MIGPKDVIRQLQLAVTSFIKCFQRFTAGAIAAVSEISRSSCNGRSFQSTAFINR